ncbi:hypothetical protein AB0I22_13200 [Streptomyces sp. NPDC050610]|uniref:hypothetical protein n=1 Tax=Streptomyces sp. NPDC050610 TaxID=3157097 RepID=UPI00342A1AB7
MSLRRAVSASLLAALLTSLSAACGQQHTAAGAPPSTSAGGGSPSASTRSSPSTGAPATTPPGPSSTSLGPSTPPGASTAAPGSTTVSPGASSSHDDGRPPAGRIDTGLAYFASAPGAGPDLHSVIRDRAALDAFAAKFGRRGQDIRAAAADTDFSRTALVGWSRTTGCDHWPSASLVRYGHTLTMRVPRHAEPPPECLAAFQVVAVFEVPKDRITWQPRFAAK